MRYVGLSLVLSVAAAVGFSFVHPFGEQRVEPAEGPGTLVHAAQIPDAATAGEGDAERGKAVFERRCTGCHALQVDREGPRLAGVYGRRAGSVSGFAYSPALKSSGIDWNDKTLEQWLSDPDQMIPQNNMSFSVPKMAERRDLIAYLKQTR